VVLAKFAKIRCTRKIIVLQYMCKNPRESLVEVCALWVLSSELKEVCVLHVCVSSTARVPFVVNLWTIAHHQQQVIMILSQWGLYPQTLMMISAHSRQASVSLYHSLCTDELCTVSLFTISSLTLWRPLLPYGYSCKAVICNFWQPGTLIRSPLSVRVPRCQKLHKRMLSGTGCL